MYHIFLCYRFIAYFYTISKENIESKSPEGIFKNSKIEIYGLLTGGHISLIDICGFKVSPTHDIEIEELLYF